MKKIVEINTLVSALKAKGMEAGICASGSSSYPLIQLAGDLEVWAFVPDPSFSTQEVDKLIGQETLSKLQ